ncbi:MAG: hypothetical protein VYD54_00520, partial [Bdellovibrionota bacterium]|nr:hypothetical protein [Bdellovibrionota bacterium]
ISKFKLGRMGKKKVGIGFKLSRTPKYVFIKIDKSPHLRARQNLFKKVISNKDGRFVSGRNTISIRKDSEIGLEGLLAKYLFVRNSRVTFSISVSNDGKNWGPIYSKHLKKWDRRWFGRSNND